MYYFHVYNASSGHSYGIRKGENATEVKFSLICEVGEAGEEIMSDEIRADEVTAFRVTDKREAIREILDAIGSEGTREMAEAIYELGDVNWKDNIWTIENWDEALASV